MSNNTVKKYIISTVAVTSLAFSPVVTGSVFAAGGPTEAEESQNNVTVNVQSGNVAEGDTGDAVAKVQQSLNEQGANLNQDGIFGENTERAVKDYQASKSLSVDGIVGPKTSESLGNDLGTTVESTDVPVEETSEQQETVTEAASQSDVVSVAQSLVGKPYVSGGTTPAGFDSSGFINYVFNQTGVSLERTHQGMWDHNGVFVDNPEIGDVVFFTNTYETDRYVTHSGVYIGNNQMIHAGTKKTGVNVADITIDYWADKYIGAKSFN